MKVIRSLEDLREIEFEFHHNFIEFLILEFKELYQAFESGEGFSDFIAPNDEAFYVFQAEDDLLQVTKNPIDIEYVEQFHVKHIEIYRIGIRDCEDVRVYYALKGIHRQDVDEWLEQLIDGECDYHV